MASDVTDSSWLHTINVFDSISGGSIGGITSNVFLTRVSELIERTVVPSCTTLASDDCWYKTLFLGWLFLGLFLKIQLVGMI